MRVVVLPPTDKPYVCDMAEPLHRSASALLGGMVEHVSPVNLRRPMCMLVNEEYMYLPGMKFNPVASYLYGTHENGHPVLGTAIILKEDGENLVGFDRKEAMKIQITMEALQFSIKATRLFEGGFTNGEE